MSAALVRRGCRGFLLAPCLTGRITMILRARLWVYRVRAVVLVYRAMPGRKDHRAVAKLRVPYPGLVFLALEHQWVSVQEAL